MLLQLLKSLLILAGTITGVSLAYYAIDEYPEVVKSAIPLENPNLVLSALLGFIGYLICSMIGRELCHWLEKRIEETNIYNLAWGAAGFTTGTVVANLLFIPFYILVSKMKSDLGSTDPYISNLLPMFYLLVPLLFNLLFAYLGIKITLRYKKYQKMAKGTDSKVSSKIIDSAAIVDGRFADLIKLGYIEGNILVPNFIVSELLFWSNSDNLAKKTRGQKGLDTIEQLKKAFPDTFLVINNDFEDIQELNSKLVRLATDLKATIITQDFNVKKVAELENIKVLNLNDLSNALKPVFISDEDIEIKIVKKGKESYQGVGFMSDGTMVVIEDGGDNVGEIVKAKVTNILQTGAGRIIFCRMGGKQGK